MKCISNLEILKIRLARKANGRVKTLTSAELPLAGFETTIEDLSCQVRGLPFLKRARYLLFRGPTCDCRYLFCESQLNPRVANQGTRPGAEFR